IGWELRLAHDLAADPSQYEPAAALFARAARAVDAGGALRAWSAAAASAPRTLDPAPSLHPPGGLASRPAGGPVRAPPPHPPSLDPPGDFAPRPAGRAVGVPTPDLASLDVHWTAALAHPTGAAEPWLALARGLFAAGRGDDGFAAACRGM